MIKLKYINIAEFKKEVYPEYKKIFPRMERKPYSLLKKTFEKNISKIIKIEYAGKFVGFMILNAIKDSKYIVLDYLAILPKYQGLGYGNKAIELLKEEVTDYYGIFIEIEKQDVGKNEKDNILRKRRTSFYEKLGFSYLGFDLNLFGVVYAAYMFYTSDIKEEKEDTIDSILNIYKGISGEERTNKYCKVII